MSTDPARSCRSLTITASALVLFVSTAASDPALNVHLVPADFSAGCTTGGIDSLTCEELNPEGESTGLQFAFVVVSGVDSLTAVQFGVTYQQTVNVLTWQSCTGGFEIPQGSWPDSATGLASAWGGIASPADSGAVIPVGYFLLDAGSSATLTLVVNPATNEATYVDHEQFTHNIDPAQLGVADVSGQGNGYNPCGAAPATLELVQLEQIAKPRGTVRDIVWSPDGSVLAFVQRNGVFVHDFAQGTANATLITNGLADVAWSPNSQRLLCLVRSRHHDGGTLYEVLTYDRATDAVTPIIEDETCDWPQVRPIWFSNGAYAVPHRGSNRWTVVGDVPADATPRSFYYTEPRTVDGQGFSGITKATLDPRTGDISVEAVPLPSQWDAKLWWLIDTIPGRDHLLVTAMDKERTRRAIITDEGQILREFDPSVAYWTDVSPDGRYAVGYMVREGAHGTGSGDTGDLWLLRIVDGSNYRLTHTPQDIEHKPYFAPDGRRIAWSTRDAIVVAEIRGMP